MARGRNGFQIEAFKFTLYVGIPVVAAAVFNDPETVRWFVDHYKFVEYPATDNTREKLKKQLEEQIQERKEFELQRKEYAKQLAKLESLTTSTVNEDGNDGRGSWWRFGWFRKNQSDSQ
mmetsp:Transcript_14300/g.18042  ORF Transcript_14300/g.18042 Transcript_14300/m.18042 type:complete len:119 (+) Transcript_14300:97-453(+)